MNRWKGLGIVAAVAGLIGLGIAFLPRTPEFPQPLKVAANVVPDTTASPSPTASPEQNAPRTASPAPTSHALPSPKPTPTTQARPTPANSPAATVATPAESPQQSPSPTVAPVTSATPEPTTAATAAAATQQQTAAPATKNGPVTLTLKKDSVIGIRLDQAVTTETAKVDEKITAKVSRDVIVDKVTAIPAGAKLEGTIVLVERASAANPRGKLGIKFTALVRPDNTRVALATETIAREASDPSAASSTAFNSNAVSALVAGNAGRVPPKQDAKGSPAPNSSKPRDFQLAAGAPLTVHLTAPVSITIDRNPE